MKIDSSNIIKIKGITDNAIESFGTVPLSFIFNDIVITHNFHVVPDNFCIPSDGIIGKDFNRRFKCLIDYSDMTFTIHYQDRIIRVNIFSEPKTNTSALPARCESYRVFHIKNFNNTCLVPSQELAEGIFIPNTIARSADVVIRVLNINASMRKINTQIENSILLSDFDIFTMKKSEQKSHETRKTRLKEYFSKRTPDYARDDLLNLCMKFADVFALPDDKLTTNNFYTQKLKLKSDDPVYVKNYRLPKTQKDEIDKQVQKLLENDLIEPSISSFNSPLILVPKKSLNGEKKWRMCVDYRMLNKNLVADKFPLPRIDEILDSLGRAKFFSVLDLYSGFWQIPIEANSREMTAFSTDRGAYQWKVLPFGINVAPNSFSRMMSIAFSGLPPESAFIYMDDLVVIGGSIKHHLSNLEKVFSTCRKFNLKLNPEKCEFFRPEVTFLGHSCTEHGIRPDNKKLETIEKYPRPNDKESTKRFTAFANYYRRFIPNFADIARPLNKLTRKKAVFKWNEECERSFVSLRDSLKSTKLLAYPDFNKEFRVTVDASNFACGAVLSQLHDGEDKPISYISRAFKQGELNKPIIEKELLAIHFAITTFRPYLYGTHFSVFSDHRPLVYLYGLKDPSSKLTRIRLEIEEYNFDVFHIKGKENVVADALSRITFESIKSTGENKQILVTTRAQTKKLNEFSANKSPVIIKKPKIFEDINRLFDTKIPRIKSVQQKNKIIIRAYMKHRLLCEIAIIASANGRFEYETMLKSIENALAKHNIYELQWPVNDTILKHAKINDFKQAGEKYLKKLQIRVIAAAEAIHNKNKQHELMTKYHSDPFFGGHMGKKKLYEKLRSMFYWKNMHKDIAQYIDSCEMCHLNKPKKKLKSPMKITKTPQSIFDTIIIDTLGPFPDSTNGNKYAVTMVCDLAKYLVTSAVPNKEAKTIARAIFNDFILIYGIMKELRSDCGTEYKNEIISELCSLLKIDHKFSTPYHHESVGSIERNHRFFNQYIRNYVNDFKEWEEYLRYFTFCYNISPHSSFNDKYSPYELVFNKNPNVPNRLTEAIEPIYNVDNYVKEAKYRLQRAHFEAKKFIDKSKAQNKKQFDKNVRDREINVDDQVYINVEPYDKRKNVNDGPYIVKEVKGENLVLLNKKNKTTKTVHRNRIRF